MNIQFVTPLLLILTISAFLAGCSNSNGVDNNITIEGTWYSDCVDVNLRPFPLYFVDWQNYVIMELQFHDGEIEATSHYYSDLNCGNFLNDNPIFVGTYALGGEITTGAGGSATQMDVVGGHPLAYFKQEFTTYYVIENGVLYMNDTATSEILINKDVAFTQ